MVKSKMESKVGKLEWNLSYLASIGWGATLFSLYSAPVWDKDFKYTLGIVAGTLAVALLGFLSAIYRITEEKLLGVYEPFQYNLEDQNINKED